MLFLCRNSAYIFPLVHDQFVDLSFDPLNNQNTKQIKSNRAYMENKCITASIQISSNICMHTDTHTYIQTLRRQSLHKPEHKLRNS